MARPRAYRHDFRCPHCGSNWTPKDSRSRGKQTPYQVRGRLYRCRECHYRFTPEGNRHYYSEAVKSQAIDMYLEGTGITAIGRVLEVQTATVLSWVKKSPPGAAGDGAGDPASGGPIAGSAAGPGDFLR